jgi:hypothetical protein
VASLTFVHLSDIHFKVFDGPEDHDLESRVREQMVGDIARVHETVGGMDAVLLVGDVAHSGRQDQYDLASEFLVSEGDAADLVGAQAGDGPNAVRSLLFDALVAAARPRDIAGIDRADRQLAIDLLEIRRQDSLWLRAAVELLVAHGHSNQLGAVLQTVFGPLHHAMTDDRLPRDTWTKLDPVLPKATDPALRLRRLLLDVGRRDQWGASEMRRAVRDAGPYATELRHNAEQDDTLQTVLKAVSKAVKWLGG